MVAQRSRDKKIPQKTADPAVSTRAITFSIAGIVALFGPLYRQTYILQKELTQARTTISETQSTLSETQSTLHRLDGASSTMASKIEKLDVDGVADKIKGLGSAASSANAEILSAASVWKNNAPVIRLMESANKSVDQWSRMGLKPSASEASTNADAWGQLPAPTSTVGADNIRAWGSAKVPTELTGATKKIEEWNGAKSPGDSETAAGRITAWSRVAPPPQATPLALPTGSPRESEVDGGK